jgi:putative transposase
MPNWLHAPPHDFTHRGAYMITGATYRNEHYLRARSRLDRFLDRLLIGLRDAGAELHAWSVFSNHYHVVLGATSDPERIRDALTNLHHESTEEINGLDGAPNRKVWFQFWDTALTFQKSYLARLKYVHFNPVHHGLVKDPSNYPWCSAAWFEREARPSFVKTVYSLKIDRISVKDPYEPTTPDD